VVLCNVLRTKIIAVNFGTIGIGIFSQFNYVYGLIFAIIPIGAIGYARYFAEHSKEKLVQRKT
jgi:hypothetical protein